MTVSTVQSQSTFLGNGSTTSFGFSFNNGVPFNSNTSLATYTLIYTDASGNQTTLSPSVYTLSFTAAVTGSLWGNGGTLVYPTIGSPIASGTSLTLNRVFPLQQLTSISNQGDFAPQNIEAMGDIEEMQIQQIAARTAQQRGVWASGVQYNNGDIVIDGANGANTGNYYSCAIPNVSSVWATDLAAGDWTLAVNIQIIAGYATSAAASAAMATTEAGIAASEAAVATTQAGIATSEAGIATTQAGIATTQAGIATTQATNAASSASSASTSATNAATSASAASSSASSASASAATATTQAGNASTSASNASTSATNAATSATAAAASAIAAGSTLNSTSTTGNTIGTGNFTFTTQANKNYQMGQPIIAASAANGANYIHGYVNSYSGTTLIITETDNSGSGTHADWNIAVTGTQGPSGGGTGSVTSTSVVSANGFAGTVANPTTTPAITLSTSVTAAALAGNGTAISAATTTGSGSTVVLSNGPTLIAPVLGTPASGVATNITGTASGLTAGHVTTNANLTGDVTSIGNATTISSSVALAGSPTTTTQSSSDNSTKIATTAFVKSAITTANVYQATPSNPTGSSSASQIMMGLAGAITPTGSGNVLIVISGDIQSGVSPAGCRVQLSYGTGTAPTNGAAVTGTQIGGNIVQNGASQGSAAFPFSVNGIATGLTLSTAYWIDLAVQSTSGGTVAVKNLSISAFEIK